MVSSSSARADQLARAKQGGENFGWSEVRISSCVEGGRGLSQHTVDEGRMGLGPVDGAPSEVGLGDLVTAVGKVHRSGDLRVRHGAVGHTFVTATTQELETRIAIQDVAQTTGHLGQPPVGSPGPGHGLEPFGCLLTEGIERGHRFISRSGG
jgi:hypothetical protein